MRSSSPKFSPGPVTATVTLGLAATLVTAACGGRYPAAAGGPGAPRGVAAAALPYAIVDGRTGQAVTPEAFWAAVGAARVVCVGEDHPNPHHHWAQLEVVDKVSASRTSGLAVGLEMVARPFQAVLDDFAAGRIDEPAMLSRVGWADRWGYDWALYQPILALAKARGAAIVGLNAPRELTKKIVRQGLASLTDEERAQMPELVLDDPDHRAWFDGVMAGMGGAHGHGQSHAAEPATEAGTETATGTETGTEAATEAEPADGAALPAGHPPVGMPSADDVYAVQVTWDETMADGAATWARGDGRQMIVLAGNGHCHDSAIVRRVARRGVSPAVSVRPIIDDGEGNVAAAILDKRNDYLFVMTMPPHGDGHAHGDAVAAE